MAVSSLRRPSHPQVRPASRAARVTEWIGRHRRATGFGAVVAALALSGVPVALGYALLAGPPPVGHPPATASPSPEADAEVDDLNLRSGPGPDHEVVGQHDRPSVWLPS